MNQMYVQIRISHSVLLLQNYIDYSNYNFNKISTSLMITPTKRNISITASRQFICNETHHCSIIQCSHFSL